MPILKAVSLDRCTALESPAGSNRFPAASSRKPGLARSPLFSGSNGPDGSIRNGVTLKTPGAQVLCADARGPQATRGRNHRLGCDVQAAVARLLKDEG